MYFVRVFHFPRWTEVQSSVEAGRTDMHIAWSLWVRVFKWLAQAHSNDNQARNQLGTPGRRRVFWEGPKYFKLCPIVLNYTQHIFPGGTKILQEGLAPCAPLVTGMTITQAGVGSQTLRSGTVAINHMRCAIEDACIFASVKTITVKFLFWVNTTRKELHPLELTSKLATGFASKGTSRELHK